MVYKRQLKYEDNLRLLSKIKYTDIKNTYK